MIELIMAHPYITIWVFLILMFERAMYCGFVVDDDSWFFNHMKPLKKQWKEKKTVKDKIKYFLRYFKSSLYSGAGVLNSQAQDHALSLFIHGLNCCLIYRMTGSLIIALLYLINPVNNQTSLWLNGRRYGLSLLAVLLAWNFWPIAPLMALFAASFHVYGIFISMLFFFPGGSVFIGMLSLVLSIGMSYKWIPNKIKFRKSEFNPNNDNQKIHVWKIVIFIKTIGYQFLHCLIPNKPAMYHDFLYYYSSTDYGAKDAYSFNLDFWKGIAVLAFLAFDHSFWSFWFLLFLLPFSNIYSVTMNVSDRYCSIPSVGVMALVVKYAMMLPDPYSTMIICLFAAFYVIKYQPLFLKYRNIENFHLYHIALNPSLINPRFFLSKFYLKHKDPFQAFALIRQGMRYRPYDFKLLLGFIECLIALGKPKSALKAMEIAEKHIPQDETEETHKLFTGIRKQYQKEYDAIRDIVDGKKRIHNNGSPYRNPNKKKRC